MPQSVRRILLVQLPVPPPGLQTIEGNIPLAAAFLKLYARRKGLELDFAIDIFPESLVNSLGDRALLDAILLRQPDLVGFTCYLWNADRSLWLAEQIKISRPEVKILLGGPEITADNHPVVEHPAVDYAIFGEGEIAFARLLESIRGNGKFERPHPPERIESLDEVSSPYLEGILDRQENTMLLETVRGCRFRCKYCYYSKRNAELRYLSYEQIEANLRYAISHGGGEVYLLDPTINQRPDFTDFLRFLARCNPERRLSFSGELRAEGIDPELVRLLKAANFTELEIGLQSVAPLAHRLMGRPMNLDDWRCGVRSLIKEGMRVRLDLILGLPGDTVDTVRQGIEFLASFRPEADIQIFNLSILPGTDFRREASALGLKYQAKPPYYVWQTPTLDAGQMHALMEEAQDALGIEFDAPALPFLSSFQAANEGFSQERQGEKASVIALNFDDPTTKIPQASCIRLVTTLRLRSSDFSQVEARAVKAVAEVVQSNPHITLQIIIEPLTTISRPQQESLLSLSRKILDVSYASTSYLDRYYSLHPGHLLSAKRLFLLLPGSHRPLMKAAWLREISQCVTILWQGKTPPSTALESFEYWIEQAE